MEKTEIVMDREKALKQIREWSLPKETREVLEALIPELRKSEDERIRKALIDGVSQIRCKGDITREQMVAYLEKQKEQPTDAKSHRVINAARRVLENWLYGDVNADVSGDLTELEYAFKDYDGEEKQKENAKSADSIPSDCVSDAKYEDRSPKHSDSDGTDIRDTPAYWKGWDDAMKQKEQNHPNGCFTCDEYKKGYEAGRLNGFTAGYNKAMKEVDQKEQKQEWNEEDEKMIERNLQEIDNASWEIRHRLKSLRPQPKQQWNDDDYVCFSEIVSLIGQHYRGENIERGNELINWLKGYEPQPHWKPSEEQMEAFKGYIEEFQAKAEAAVGGWNNFDVMIRLFEQLKELM